MKFHTTFYVLAAVVATALATVHDVIGDIQNIAQQAQSLDTAITNFPTTGGNISTAQSIHDNSVNLGQAIDKGTTDIQDAGTLSETDGQGILSGIGGIQPTISDALTQIVDKKDAIAGLPLSNITTLVLEDLKSLDTSTSAFGAALIAALPTDLQAQAASIKSTVDAEFATAIAAYSS